MRPPLASSNLTARAARRPAAGPPSARAAARGFTLVELMVAMSGGLFISIVVFALSRDTSRFYQQETRVAHATLSGVNGFERLASDISRAGHLSTPNINADPRVCNPPDGSAPAILQNLRAIIIDSSGLSASGTEVERAGITPRAITLTGALNAPEELHTRTVLPNANGTHDVSINLRTPAAYRIGLRLDAQAGNLAVLQNTFMSGGVGKIIRLRRMGKEQYAVVGGVSTTADTATLTLAAAPLLVVRTSDESVQCGLGDAGGQMGLSVIDIVRYEIRSMTSDANYSELFKASGASGLPYEAGRAELVRVELDPTGAEIDGTREIISEYAVDLQFGAWRASSANPSASTIVPEDADSLINTFAFTQLLRGMHVRLSVRSREADRDLDVQGGGGGGSRDIFRVPLTLPDNSITYARARTFQADVPLRNLENSNW